MIDYLKGEVVLIESEFLVMDVKDVGYRVFCANPYAFQAETGQQQTVYIHYHVRDDAILLYGFQSREEQALFRRLIEVSGIGPRVAISILSGSRPEAIIAAIQQENISFLIKLPGIGKKTAQRIILDLKDKLSAFVTPMGLDESDMASFGLQSQDGGEEDSWLEARQGLLALGYTESELHRCYQQIKPKLKETDSTDVVMKLALQALYKG